MIRFSLRGAGLALCLLLLLLRPETAGALDVFACEPEWAALTQELGGNTVTAFSATTARQDPHHIQARPSLIARLRAADNQHIQTDPRNIAAVAAALSARMQLLDPANAATIAAQSQNLQARWAAA